MADQPEPKTETRSCDWPGCEDEGVHRAPRSREDLHSYRWFCLAHVRQYNAAWNYYAGMSEDEVENDVRHDTVWRRPTWRPGAAPLGFAFKVHDIGDDLGPFADGGTGTRNRDRHPPPHQGHSEDDKALGILGLKLPVTATRVKARYKELVKRYHPDVTGGDKASEEKFKEISQAYRTIMERLNT
jgi:hypothetical protein